MAQADLNVANQSGSAFRADLNNQLLALGTLMSGATEPSTTYAYMLWADTTANFLKMRNAANNGWLVLRGLEGKLAVGTTVGSNVNFRVNRDVTGATTAFAQYIDPEVQSDVTVSALGIGTSIKAAASATIASLIHYQAATGSLGAGSSITTQIGFSASSSLDGATNDYGFFGNIGAGTGNWNCYMGGAAPNYFAGQVQLGAGAVGTPSLSTNGDTNTGVYFPGADRLGFVTGGTQRGEFDASGRLLVNVLAPLITSDEIFSVAGGASAFQRNSGAPIIVNRNTSDGTLVGFYQDSTLEGSIDVSGTTVSYNGAHLSRWSQLPGGAIREEILRGTVLSNIDEMCDWGEEDNEQLNRMKVSDVEGDPNVAGVFQGWDDDDDTYTDDFYCAMTGDFMIRIAEGVAVQRGDLLMSAGDGTAKPQDDDIIRSKTIAKVTSTHVTCTYDDGSYCVPCVLMAC